MYNLMGNISFLVTAGLLVPMPRKLADTVTAAPIKNRVLRRRNRKKDHTSPPTPVPPFYFTTRGPRTAMACSKPALITTARN